MNPYDDLNEHQAILITGLQYKIVERRDRVEMYTGIDMRNAIPIEGENAALLDDFAVHHHVMPISRFFKREDGELKSMYIAWSPEVEHMLRAPYTIMANRLQANEEKLQANEIALNALQSLCGRQSDRLSNIDSANFWTRLKYLFGADI